jgi:hypothetical protein
MTECKPVLNTKGKKKGTYARGGSLARKLREILISKEGNCPDDGARYLIRHLCKNDSYAHKTGKIDWICGEHITWGTYKQNVLDQDPEVRKECRRKIARAAMKSGNHVSIKKVTCPHCGKTGQNRVMKRYHFDRCKSLT